jgi:hypothetical protein
LVYADARLIFLDDYGLPTFQPSAEHLGFAGGEIVWEKSQIRTFQYAPWNFKRQVRDTDRCGIEKGSVFFIDLKNPANHVSQGLDWVGEYWNEGFGKVIFNPDFLEAEEGKNGRAKYKYKADKPEKEKAPKTLPQSETKLIIDENDSILIKYLKHQNNREISEQNILKKVNDFVTKHRNRFQDDQFASQWGTIRSMAMQSSDRQELANTLFQPPEGYLVHGDAKYKWDQKRRMEVFKEFFNNMTDDTNYKQTMINLSAEMAKISKK